MDKDEGPGEQIHSTSLQQSVSIRHDENYLLIGQNEYPIIY